MTTDEDAFLDGIRAQPDDDALRLVYADWLEERGDPRAELVRVQCELARLDVRRSRRRELERRERELIGEHFDEWIAPLMDAGAASVRIERGLIEAENG